MMIFNEYVCVCVHCTTSLDPVIDESKSLIKYIHNVHTVRILTMVH